MDQDLEPETKTTIRTHGKSILDFYGLDINESFKEMREKVLIKNT